MTARLWLPLVFGLLLAGCDQLGIATPAAKAAKRDADAKAVGGACRHAGRAIEDCYTLNKQADKAAVYAGWREMEEYMRENKLEAVAPVIKPEPPAAPASGPKAKARAKDDADAEGEEDDADEEEAETPAKSGGKVAKVAKAAKP
jgi:hypothetical protein